MKENAVEKDKVVFKFEVLVTKKNTIKYRLKGSHIADVVLGLEWAKEVMLKRMTKNNEEIVTK